MLIDRRPLSVPAFRRLWFASLVAAIGGSFSLIAVPVQLFALTGSSVTVGLSAVVSFPALLIVALAGGSAADRHDRRRLLLVAQSGLALTYLLLWARTATDGHSVVVLLVLVGAQALSAGAIMTVAATVLPRIVPVELLPAANALTSLVRYTAAVVGPLLAGLLIPVTGVGTLYLLDALALLVVLWSISRLPALPAPGPGRPRPGSGFRVLIGDRLLVATLGIDLAAMVFGLPWALYPELAAERHSGPGLGALYAAYPLGVLALGLLSGTFTRTRRPGRLLTLAALTWGATLVLAAAALIPALTVLALGLGGAVNLVLSTARNSITQAHTDDRFRGRVQGVLTVVLFGGPQAATLVHGLAGSVLGARPAIALGGALTTLTVTAIAAGTPQLWLLESPRTRSPALRQEEST